MTCSQHLWTMQYVVQHDMIWYDIHRWYTCVCDSNRRCIIVVPVQEFFRHIAVLPLQQRDHMAYFIFYLKTRVLFSEVPNVLLAVLLVAASCNTIGSIFDTEWSIWNTPPTMELLFFFFVVVLTRVENHVSFPQAMRSCQLSTRHWEIDGLDGFHRCGG